MTIAATPAARRASAQRRLLTAARCRFAEDALAEAVSAGTRQVVLLGTALDTFASHNPYPGLRVFEITGPDLDLASAAAELDHHAAVFVIRLETGLPTTRRGSGDDVHATAAVPLPTGHRNCTSVTVTLQRVSALATGSEIVFDHPAHRTAALPGFLNDTGFELLEDLGPRELASRYLDRPIGSTHSSEPRVLRARVRHNAGRPPSSIVVR
ncbi:class I SAM-dependent methyltransferase [Nocardia sp. NBC_01327]|uniref:class I SAM-dependent methyltransferase n=1 Tax=Nocardia sp. NBC_01327 TaxID=2903593 RepID=UPI002E15D01F|nr:class I SAM-dependent methyltransferase [Nocardia sp. NBC_01327]